MAKSEINRAAFESIVSEKSPLSPNQIDKMFGAEGVTAENKAIAWKFLNLGAKAQMQVWNWATVFPEATLEKIR